jgi:hypothetical protein
MPMFHEHPDGWIYIRTDAGTYADTRAHFEADFGQPLEPLPAGADQHVYQPGVVHSYMGGGNVIAGGPSAWQYGDDALAAYDQLLTKQTARKSLGTELDMGRITKEVVSG